MKLRHVVALAAHPSSIAALSVVSVLLARDKSAMATRLGVALPLAVLTSKALKRMFPTVKPRWFLSLTPRESFPSGHSVATAALMAAFARKPRYLPLALASIALVNAARVRSKQHRVHEVLAGDAIGIGAAVIGTFIARR